MLGGVAISNSSIASFLNNHAIRPIGLQLFTLFNVIDNDVSGNIKKIADIEYKEIESAFSRKGDFYGMGKGVLLAAKRYWPFMGIASRAGSSFLTTSGDSYFITPKRQG